MNTPPARVVVFLDYQNVHNGARRAFWPARSDPAKGHIEPVKLAQRIVAKRNGNGLPSRLSQVRIYRGMPNPHRQPGAAAASSRQTNLWSHSPLVALRQRPLRYPPGWPEQPAVEKGIDVAMAVDILRLAVVDDAYDVAVVFSGDSDLLPAIEAVIELKCGHIEVAAWRGGGKRLRIEGASRPWCHWLDEVDYRSVEDRTDYRRPGVHKA